MTEGRIHFKNKNINLKLWVGAIELARKKYIFVDIPFHR